MTHNNMISPEGLFKRAVEAIREIEPLLKPGYTYRSEYLAKPKHNTLCYDRIPKNYLMIFDIDAGLQCYLPAQEKKEEAARLGLESIPVFFSGIIENLEMFRELLNHESCLGGQKIEGVVIKNYRLFAPDKKVLMGKFVSEAFKESHSKEWKVSNPSQGDIVQLMIDDYRTPARWAKAVQHLRDAGELEGSPRDIERLMKEIPLDVEKECAEEIKEKIYKWAWPKIARGIRAGFPEWYKEELLKKQFEG